MAVSPAGNRRGGAEAPGAAAGEGRAGAPGAVLRGEGAGRQPGCAAPLAAAREAMWAQRGAAGAGRRTAMAADGGWVPDVYDGAARRGAAEGSREGSAEVTAVADGARLRQGGAAARRPLAHGAGHGAARLAAALRGWQTALALPRRQ